MMLLKSHLHNDGNESYQTTSTNDNFFGKLVQIMELAFKQILSLMDASDMTRSFDDSIDVLEQDIDDGDIEVTEPKITQVN